MFNRFACRLFLLRINSRQYAKKAAHNKSSSSSSSNNGASELQEFDFSKFSDRMDHCVDKFRQELSQLRLGRANTSLLENIRVQLPSKSADKNHHKHQNVKLSQLAQLIVKDPQTVHVVVADEQTATAIDKSILGANLNLTPQLIDQNLIKVSFPKMSQEYRNTIAKQVSSMAETSKVRVRGHRQDARNALKKHSKLMAQDAMRDMENTIQEATDKSCKQIDQLAKEKSFEIQKS